MHKILPRTRVITRRVHRILKIRRRRKWLLRMAVKLTSIVFLHHHHHRHHISIVSLHHHHISIVFYPSPTRFTFFCCTIFYKRLPTAMISWFCSNVSCSEQQSWFSSAVSWLPCSLAPVSFKDSYSRTTTCASPSLIQFTYGTHFHTRRK